MDICIGNESEIASWNNFQSKQSVTLGNLMTINIMLIHWYTYVNNLSYLSYFEFALLRNRWKVKDIGNL